MIQRTFLRNSKPKSITQLKRYIWKSRGPSSKEYFDDEDTFNKNVDLVSDILQSSKRTMVFCGAGLSTVSGIPDYRSGYDTKLNTGPGKWEREKYDNKPYDKPHANKYSIESWPNDGHLALKALEQNNLIHHLVSQNVDGLLSKTMISDLKVSELHGNVFKERCMTCSTEYWRDFSTTKKDMRRITERRCLCTEGKPGYTIDVESEQDLQRGSDIRVSLVYFGDSLQPEDLEKSAEEMMESDFCFSIGSSMQVTPASNIVRNFIKSGKKVAILNLQKTSMHSDKTINIHSFCDKFLDSVRENLGLEKPKPEFYKDMRIEQNENTGLYEIKFYDFENKEFDIAKNIRIGSSYSTKEFRPAFNLDQLSGNMEIEFYVDQGKDKVEINLDAINKENSNNIRFWWNYEGGDDVKFDRIEF